MIVENDQIVSALARLGERIDGVTLAVGMMRMETQTSLRELREELAEHARDTDRRFNASAVIVDTKVGEVYKAMETREQSFTMRLIAIAGLSLTALGAFTALVVQVVIPALTKVR